MITEKCLIATDVDQTILAQRLNQEEEKLLFFRRIAPQLVESARLGGHVGFITGNSMDELCSRFLESLLEQLCHTGDLTVIAHFHFFCNSGGVYFHFPSVVVEHSIQRSKVEHGERLRKDFWRTVILSEDGKLRVHPQFVDSAYVEHCLIPVNDADIIERVLKEAAQDYMDELNRNIGSHEQRYDLSWIRETDGGIKVPKVEPRSASCRFGAVEKTATVQITLKPVLSFRQARSEFTQQLVGKDVRSNVVHNIQEKLDHAGLGHYVARPGGRASIDVTLARLDKAYALEFLIDHLRLQGNIHRGEQFGSNTIYFGDEVMVGGGNDYPITRIPGLLVFAVNRERELVPFMRDVLVPSAIFEGVEATADVLTQFNHCARRLLREFQPGRSMKTAIEALKEEIFSSRISEKVADLRSQGMSVDDWQTLHTFVTLMARDQGSGRQWLSLLVKELDSIMMQLPAHSVSSIPAPGTSHPDE
jgi:hydroxymethylpyrimidine pyrophosphatase-like HAD family hydrolase